MQLENILKSIDNERSKRYIFCFIASLYRYITKEIITETYNVYLRTV